MSRKTIFTLPITTYEEAFLATIPLPPGPTPRKCNNRSERHKRNRHSRWEKEDHSSPSQQHVNGYHGPQSGDLSEAEFLDMFRPPTPLENGDSPSKLSIPEVIVTQGDRKGSFEDIEFKMYYEHNSEPSFRINNKNLVVPSMVGYPDNLISRTLRPTEDFLPCSRFAKDTVESWINGFECANDSSLLSKTDEISVVVTASEVSTPHVNGDDNSYIQQVGDADNAQNWYQNNGINETAEQVELGEANGAWPSPNSSKVKLGKFKFLRNEHCSELVSTFNRVISDACQSSKTTGSDDSDSIWARVGSSDVEDHQFQTFTSAAEENKDQNESAGNQKASNRRRKGGNSGTPKAELQGERRRSSRIKSMEEKREREREKLREVKDFSDDCATANSNEVDKSTTETRSQSPLTPTTTPSDTREELSILAHQEERSGESTSKLDGEFAVPPSPWNGISPRANKESSADGGSGRQGDVGPVKVKSRWRRCSELESVCSGSRGEIVQSSNLNSASPNSSDFYNCTPPPPPSTLPPNVNCASEMFGTPPPPPPSVGFFSPGEITEDWSEQEVTTSLTKNPLPLRLRPVTAVTPSQADVKAMAPPPPPPPKEKPAYLTYEEITENLYLSSRMRSKARKEVRRMVCDCILTKEEITRGCLGCGEDCLNRLLMMECGSRCNTGDRCGNRKFQKKEYAKVEPFKTDKKGWGLRAVEDLDEGIFVTEYVGEVLDQREFKKRVKEYAADKQRHHYFMALKADQIIDATQKGSWSRFINHSCDPNCETQKWTVSGELRIGFFTRRMVKAGDEITFDYQFQRYGKEAQRCYCEAKRRREFGEDSDLQEELEKLNHLLGLTNRNQTLNLCRLMVRADDAESRTILMHCLQRTQEVACLRLFLDYHGLSLIWSWMMDIGNSETSTNIKAEILKTLSKLPVTSRNAVMESKLMPVIQKWAAQLMEAGPPIKKMKTNGEEETNDSAEIKITETFAKNVTDNVEKKDDCGTQVESTGISEEIIKEKDIGETDNTDALESADTLDLLMSPSDIDENSADVQMTVVDEVGITEDGNSADSETKMETDFADSNSQLSIDSADASSSDAILMDITTVGKSVEKKSELTTNCDENLGKIGEEHTTDGEDHTNDCEERTNDGKEHTKDGEDHTKDGEEHTKDGEEHTKDGEEHIKDSEEISKDSDELKNGEVISKDSEDISIDDEEFNKSSHVGATNRVQESDIVDVNKTNCNSQELGSVDNVQGATKDESNMVDSVFNLATKLLGSWSELKQLYRIPKREQAQNRHDHEREAGENGDRSRRDRYRDRDRGRRDYYRKRRGHSTSQPKISKEERRQLFEQKVQQEEQEALRWQQAEYYRQQQEAQMEMYYSASYAGIPGQAIAYYDPASGYAIPAIAAPVTADLVVDATPTATPDINVPAIPAVGTIVPTVIPQIVPIDPTGSSPIAGVPAVVSVEGPVLPPAAFDAASGISTPTAVPAPVVYPIYPAATPNNTASGYSPVAQFVTPQGQPIYYPPPQGVVVHIPPDQAAWPHIIPAPVDAPLPLEPPKPVKLPPSWKTAKDEEGNTYYYHTVTRQTQWDPPPYEESDDVESVPDDNPKNKKNAVNDSSSEHSRRIKEAFRSKMSQFIVQYLNPYRKPDCKQGRISSTEEFKHLARKLTHFVMAKELKYCKNVEDLECNENVKHKAKDFVRKYMSKFGAVYKKTASPKEEDD
ncbi:histone methyltransferase set2 [Chamberlinius hualienensis]